MNKVAYKILQNPKLVELGINKIENISSSFYEESEAYINNAFSNKNIKKRKLKQ